MSEDVRDRFIMDFSPEITAKIDVLIEKGLYKDRADFLEKAIGKELKPHETSFEEMRKGSNPVNIGIVKYSADELRKVIASNKRLRIRAIDSIIFGNDVTPELVSEAIERINLTGILRGPDDVLEVLNARRYTLFGRQHPRFKQLTEKTEKEEDSE